jgi:prokaryotic ubiquitin-like protein Pup
MAREGGQQHRTGKRADETEEAPEPDSGADVAERKERLDEDVDAILDEIDDVLEENAEDFVRSFVQKGGQ